MNQLTKLNSPGNKLNYTSVGPYTSCWRPGWIVRWSFEFVSSRFHRFGCLVRPHRFLMCCHQFRCDPLPQFNSLNHLLKFDFLCEPWMIWGIWNTISRKRIRSLDLDNNTTNISRLILRLKQANVGIANILMPSTQNQRLYLHTSINCTCSKLVKVTYFFV